VDDEHVLAFIEAVHRTHFDAVHVLALDAALIDDIGHGIDNFLMCRERAATLDRLD
jgi:hypothetical protein